MIRRLSLERTRPGPEIIDRNFVSGWSHISLRLTWGLTQAITHHENGPSLEGELPGSIDTSIVVKKGVVGAGPTEMRPCPSCLSWNQAKLAQAGVPPTTDDQVVVNRYP